MLVYDNPIKAEDIDAKVTYNFQNYKLFVGFRSAQRQPTI